MLEVCLKERMDIEEKTSAAGISTYCCLGTLHLKTASVGLCLVYLLGLAQWWYATIPVAVGDRYTSLNMDDVVTIIALFTVVVWAMIGINLENELYLIPIVLAHLFSLVFIGCRMLTSCFGHTPLPPTAILLMQLVPWLALLGGMVWAMTIFLGCGFLFSTNYFTVIQQENQTLPLKSPATTPPKYCLP